MRSHFILYVRDQKVSCSFYEQVLGYKPKLNVPGMTEFLLSADSVLGLMPEKGIKQLLGSSIQNPESTNGISRAEIYLVVISPEEYMDRAISAGGRLLSKVEPRNWGDRVGYIADLDGHVLALATKI